MNRGGFRPKNRLDVPEGLDAAFQEQPLFPKFDFPDKSPPSEAEERLVYSDKHFHELLRASPCYLTRAEPPPRIKRYSDRFKVTRTRPSLALLKTDLAYFPAELHVVIDPSKQRKAGGILHSRSKDMVKERLEAIAAAAGKEEASGRSGGKADDGDGDEDGDPEDDMEQIDEMDEDENDYLIDYFDEERDEFEDTGE